ncbi:uncharacterized protein LOC131326234 [Rhododendron vialii]|uniref:uncharacterized protein LOC131326234 n=1 Tax=Rhododendron vialii TaxID=182163 RepID=UPI00265EA551|nr:uncharacterized protein LOC131326234 [Rhododendron vialii]XP_058214914.1 uncharacterized protein LOC131326234 [Rhododendron vialii]
MDRSWMALSDRFSQPYVDGVDYFNEFASANSGEAVEIKCPCIDCRNFYKHKYDTIKAHLLVRGIMLSYTTWLLHGEIPEPDDQDESDDENNKDNDDVYGELLNDHYRGTYMDDDTSEKNGVQDFEKLLEASQCGLYPRCKKSDTLLAFVIEMLQVKVQYRWSNSSFNVFLSSLRRFLPEGHVAPRSIDECKKLLRDLGLGYELIDACPNDCVLYWKENAHLEKCPNPKCQRPRYKVNDGKGKKIPHKILRYFPVTPRLQRLYMNPDIVEDMKWHSDKRVDDEDMRHPADTPQWKRLDEKYPEFSWETRNVRLGFATDGFNPFGNMSTSYSMWPVILIPYNLPPWRCMKDPFFMMPLLIPGPNQPGTNIDVYLRPLVDELKELWKNGVRTYDASTKETFQMHAAIIRTIHDLPAYGDVSGWRTKGYLACPTCNDSPLSHKLISKIGWFGHRAYLPDNHPLRKDKKFNGLPEFGKKTLDLPVEKVMAQLARLRPVEFGKDTSSKKRPRHVEELNWTKKSILWELEYFSELLVPHMLDVMHIEKNICESLYGTMLGIDGKNKDTYKARDDLKVMGIRPELHLQVSQNGTIVKPRAMYTLDSHQVDEFYEFLKSISYPDGYASNISRCVNSKHGRLSGMKSHDCHVLLQRLFPIGMRGFVNKEICTTLFELGNFFQELCSKTIKRSEMEKWEERAVLILCKLERIFPPAFFDVMVHLTVHLSREAMIAGPVHYRWMYPIERFLGKLKGYVSNKARPEGSIAEAYILKECITFCSMYLKRGTKNPERNNDGGIRGLGMEIFHQRVRLFSPITRAPDPSQKEREMAHWFVLYNCPEVEPYLEEHESIIQIPQGCDVTQIQREQFPIWFKKRMNDLRSQGSPKATEELWSLANGPGSIIGLYSGCISNGFRFHTRDREKRRMCQNSGLVVEGLHKGKTINFYGYGYLCKIWELRYSHGDTVVLFKCEWYNTGHKKRIYTDGHVTSIDITRLWYKDDPFVLPSNVRQVFYVNDTSKGKNWRVVELVRHRGVWDIPEQVESPNEPFQQDETTDSGVPIFIENDVGHNNRDDADPEIILEAELLADHGDDEDDTMAEYIDDEDNELSGQADTNAYVDVDLEIDVDYDD